MKVKLISQTTPASVFSFETNIRTLEDLCAYCARVSNPNNQQNTETSRKLINYLIKNKYSHSFRWITNLLVDALLRSQSEIEKNIKINS